VTTPSDSNAAANAVAENSAVGTVVGVTAFASDADATTNAVSYSLTDSAGGKFAIDATTGVVTVAGAIDREATASLDITVRATSQDGSHADQVMSIAINDVNEFAVTKPVDSDLAAERRQRERRDRHRRGRDRLRQRRRRHHQRRDLQPERQLGRSVRDRRDDGRGDHGAAIDREALGRAGPSKSRPPAPTARARSRTSASQSTTSTSSP
jgi:hypothetical protein